MRGCEPFLPDDLQALDGLLSQATAVVAMEDIFDGVNDPNVIAMRHDCDNEIHSSVQLAAWEAARGYRATFYVLHTAEYFMDKPLLRESLERIAGYGHEIAVHNDALTVALATGRAPADVLHDVIDELCGYGHRIRSTVAHGHRLCQIARYVNDEIWIGCERADYGAPDRVLHYLGCKVEIPRLELATFGLDFDANWIRRGDYLSDSGGRWSQDFDAVASAFPSKGQLHILQHPCWWGEAFERVEAAA